MAALDAAGLSDATGLSDARNAAHGVRAGTGQGGLFPELHQSDDGSRPRPPVAEPLAEKMVALLRKAGYEVVFPENMERLCCDTIWESKGMADIADRKTAELEEALAGAVRPEPLPAPHARKDRPHETLRTGGVHLDLPARPAGVPALSPCMSPARCAAWGCPG